MYDYLEGTVARRSAVGVTLDVEGVGYALALPLGTELPPEGAVARVWTHLAVREDAHTLYGFADRGTRDLFRHLLRVKGVGPSLALAVLSGLSGSELVEVIRAEDAPRLTTVKGVGRKTAEQILLDLRDQLPVIAAGVELEPGVITPAAPSEAAGNLADAVAALVSLGFSPKEARGRVERAAREVDPADVSTLVQAAFQG